MHRSLRPIIFLVVSLTLFSAACGDDDDSTAAPAAENNTATDSTADEATDPAAADETPGEATPIDEATEPAGGDVGDAPSAYPVTIEHRLGEAVIPTRPERIVTLNVQWTDAVLAMGEVPVAYMLSEAVGETAPYPWQEGLLDDAERIDTAGPIPFEKIAALDPDLILVTFAASDPSDFDTLSQIAPTIGLFGDVVDPWTKQVHALGLALGDADTAADVIASVDDQIAATAAALPGLKDKTYSFANLVPGDGIYVIADPADGASELFNALGMVLDPDIVALDELDTGRAKISFEQVGLLQADLVGVLLNGAERDAIVGLAELPSAQQGTLIDLALPDIVGLNTPTPLSVPYLVELISPSLELVAGSGA